MKSSHNRFGGKIVLITGASHGIGKQTALDFALAGAKDIILVARTESKLAELEGIIRAENRVRQVNVVSYCCDVSNKMEVSGLAQKVIGRFGYVDILVNNAGIGIYGKLEDQAAVDLELVMLTNYLGTAYLPRLFLARC